MDHVTNEPPRRAGGDKHTPQAKVDIARRAQQIVAVVFAYDGFVDEFRLREGFIKYLETHGSGRHGLGVGSLPTLVICGQNSIVKLNGCPYIAPMDSDGWWTVLASNAENPLRILLELIWTRLSFGDRNANAVR